MKKAAASPEVFNFSNRVDHARPKKRKKKKIYVHTYISFTARRQGKGFPRQESTSQISLSFWIPKNSRSPTEKRLMTFLQEGTSKNIYNKKLAGSQNLPRWLFALALPIATH